VQLRGEPDRGDVGGAVEADLIWYWAAKSMTFFSGEMPPKWVDAART
jgi:hypothetical protein